MDGKISTKDRCHIDPSQYDRYLMDVNRRRADAVLIGAGTLRAFKQPALIERKRFQLYRKAQKKNPQPINVVIARNIDFDPSWPFFADQQVERVVIVPSSTPESALKPFHSLAHIFKYEQREDFPEQIIQFLSKLGCKSLLLEGGGNIMFPWAERDLIDEWNITIVPAIMGGETAPTMVEGEGFTVDQIKRYRLKKHFRRQNEIFLKYVRR